MKIRTYTKRLADEALAIPTATGFSRRISEVAVQKHIRALEGGFWRWEVADPIRLGPDGAVYNGRHRLIAVSRCAVPLKTYVQENVDPETFIFQDTGRARTGAEMTRLAGHSQQFTAITGAANYVNQLNGLPYGDALSAYEREQLVLSDPIFTDLSIYSVASELNKEFKIPQAGSTGALIWLVQNGLAPKAKIMGIYRELLDDTFGDESIARELAELVDPPNRDRAGNKLALRGKRKERHYAWREKQAGGRRDEFTGLLIDEIWKRLSEKQRTPEKQALIDNLLSGSGMVKNHQSITQQKSITQKAQRARAA
jgi:hypothetical protein